MLLFFIAELFIQTIVWRQCATQLTVLTLPEALVSSSGNVVEGSVIQIYCTVENDTTVTFTWTFNGSPLLSDPPHIRIREDNRPERSLSLITNDSTSVLTVDNFRDTDNGVYQCTATDGSGNTGNGTAVKLTAVPSAPVGSLVIITEPSDLEVSPNINLHENRSGIRFGGTFPPQQLSCTAGHQGDDSMSFLAPSVVWVRDGQVVDGNDPDITITNSMTNGRLTSDLNIADFQASDAGVYQCVFTDDSDGGEVITTIPFQTDAGNIMYVERISPVVIILRPPEKLVIEVSVSGNYEALSWYKGVVGTPIPQSIVPQEFPNFNEMFVRDNTTDDDEGVYIMQVNPKTNPSLPAHDFEPEGGTLEFAVIPPADAVTTSLSPDTVIIPEGGSADISCRSVGAPVPTITWELNNQTTGFEQTDTETPLAILTGSVGNRMVDLTPGNIESTLHIVSAMYPDHDGVYTCIGTNADDPSIASSSAQISVRVNVIPELSFEQDFYRFQAGTSPTITCIVVARAPGTFAELVEVIDEVENVRATSEGDTILTLEHTILNIQLNRHNSMFICRAANDIGGAVSIATNITVFNPCEGFECPSSATCELFESMPDIMEAYCVPSCDLDNGGCRGDEICTLVPQDPLECLQLDAPCPPTVTCSPRDTCATVRCRNGYVCKVHSPTGKAFCEPSCDLNNGGCSPGTHCIVRDNILCTDGPCPPLRSCCPHPRCDINLCAARRTRRALCTNPFISESCEGGSNECPVTFCHVCYFSESDRSLPGECGDSCSNYTTSNSCSRRWATCIRRAYLRAYGQAWPRRRNRIEGDFRCYNSPCAQN